MGGGLCWRQWGDIRDAYPEAAVHDSRCISRDAVFGGEVGSGRLCLCNLIVFIFLMRVIWLYYC